MNDYAELAWAHWDKELSDKSISHDDMIKQWASMVHDKMPDIKSEDIEALFTNDDKHNTMTRARAIWKYGASRGISGTPQIYINGVMLNDYPMEEDAWKRLINEFHPARPTNASDMYIY